MPAGYFLLAVIGLLMISSSRRQAPPIAIDYIAPDEPIFDAIETLTGE